MKQNLYFSAEYRRNISYYRYNTITYIMVCHKHFFCKIKTASRKNIRGGMCLDALKRSVQKSESDYQGFRQFERVRHVIGVRGFSCERPEFF